MGSGGWRSASDGFDVEPTADVFGYEVDGVLHLYLRGVEGEIVGGGVAPAFVGIEIVESGPEFVDLAGFGFGFLSRFAVTAGDYAGHAVGHVGMHENVDGAGMVAEYVIGCASNYHAWLTVCQHFDELALLIVDRLIADGVVAIAQHRWVDSEIEREHAVDERRGFLVGVDEQLGVHSGVAGGFDKQLLVIEFDAESGSYESAEFPASAAELPSDCYNIVFHAINLCCDSFCLILLFN